MKDLAVIGTLQLHFFNLGFRLTAARTAVLHDVRFHWIPMQVYKKTVRLLLKKLILIYMQGLDNLNIFNVWRQSSRKMFGLMLTLGINMHSVWLCKCELYFTGQWSIRCACALTLKRCYSCHCRTSLLWVGQTCSHLQ